MYINQQKTLHSHHGHNFLRADCIRRSFGATTTETTGTASAVHRNRLDGLLEPLNKSRPSLRAD